MPGYFDIEEMPQSREVLMMVAKVAWCQRVLKIKQRSNLNISKLVSAA